MISIPRTALGTATALFCLGHPSQGTSEVAQYVAQMQAKGRDFLQSSNAFGVSAPVALAKLQQTAQECSMPNWDGYGAHAVSLDTLANACRFLKALPLGAPTPEFGADPDGDLNFEWHRSPERTLSVSLSGKGDIYYAAILGARKSHGSEPFFGEVPRDILNLIEKVTGA